MVYGLTVIRLSYSQIPAPCNEMKSCWIFVKSIWWIAKPNPSYDNCNAASDYIDIRYEL